MPDASSPKPDDDGLPVLTPERLAVANALGDEVSHGLEIAGLAGLLLVIGEFPDGAGGVASYCSGVDGRDLPTLLRWLADLVEGAECLQSETPSASQ